jgi:hypothetical protein
MTREHLIADIQNVIVLSRDRSGAVEGDRLRAAFDGLVRHVEQEGEAPERVTACLAESVRVLGLAGPTVDDDTWDYARTCLEAALDFARSPRAAN